jgi:hypothetical protein
MKKLVLNAKHTVSVINKLSDRHHLLKYLLCFVKQRHRTKYIYVWLKEFECYGQFLYSFIHFSLVPNLEHRAPFGVSMIALVIRHAVGLLWTTHQPIQEASTYTGQHDI